MSKTKKNSISAYILLDRSGSMMGARWKSAIDSINKYVMELNNNKAKGNVTVVAFDLSADYANAKNAYKMSFDVIKEKVDIKKWEIINQEILVPRGSTPLYDATAKIISMAEENNNERTIIIIVTDGEENASKEYNNQTIKEKIKSITSRGWEVVFLGADFNADKLAEQYNLSKSKVINTSYRGLASGMSYFASATVGYADASLSDIRSEKGVIDTTEVKDELSKI